MQHLIDGGILQLALLHASHSSAFRKSDDYIVGMLLKDSSQAPRTCSRARRTRKRWVEVALEGARREHWWLGERRLRNAAALVSTLDILIPMRGHRGSDPCELDKIPRNTVHILAGAACTMLAGKM